MTEFRSYIFEKEKPKKRFPWLEIMAIWVGIIILNNVSDFDNFWLYAIPLIVLAFIGNKLYAEGLGLGKKEEPNGYFTDELIINETGVKIAAKLYPTERIKSLEIKYIDIFEGIRQNDDLRHGLKSNGENNMLRVKLNDNQIISKQFKLVSIEHAKELLKITIRLEDKINIQNDWKISYNA